MCGIAGIFIEPGHSLNGMRERLTAMAQAMYHRGPDDEGIYCSPDGRVGLASRRLAIQDLSSAGHMPMSNDNGTVWLTYNGEIYNAAELRKELQSKGFQFRSHSDTEVLLNGYQAWGEEVVHRLRGMWAFAIYDNREQSNGKLFLARDRLGIKPLYYARTLKTFVFASELKALQAARLTSHEISPAGLVGYLSLGAVPNPLTIYRDIHALEPAHSITISSAKSTSDAQPNRYWSLPTNTVECSDAEAVTQMREALKEAVRIRLVSDVPLGAFLSGGLDSSGVVGLMRAATSGPIRTCSIVFEEDKYSEASYARAMAESVGAEHFERTITARDLAGELDNILAAMDQPTIDGVNTYFVSQTAKQAGLTVALSGLGGDELFGGYPNTFGGVPQMLRSLRMAQRIPGGSILAGAAIGLSPHKHRLARVRDALKHPASLSSAYLTRRGLFSLQQVRQLVTPEIWQESTKHFDAARHVAAKANSEYNGTAVCGKENLFQWVSRAELSTYTHQQLLRDTDVMSMAHSLEVRVPLLDHVLVEKALRIPTRIKQQGTGPKPLLNAALGNVLPPAIRDRRDKQGFTFPFDIWLRGAWKADATARLQEVQRQNWLQSEQSKRLFSEFEAGKIHWSRPWAMIALGSLLER
jgi:asparagine synthase (glutamine-hydrolysing)